MKLKSLVIVLTTFSTLLSFCANAQAFLPPDRWQINAMKVNNKWTYTVDPPGLTLFDGDFNFDGGRLNNPTVLGLNGFNTNAFLVGGVLSINGTTTNPKNPNEAVFGDIFDVTFDALDLNPTPPTVNWSGSIASGFDESGQSVDFDAWNVSFPVPEPGSLMLALCGAAGLLAVRPRRR